MKRSKIFIGMLLLGAIILSAQLCMAYTAEFKVDDTIDFSLVDGIDLALTGVGDPLNDLTLNIVYTFQGGAIPGIDGSALGLGIVTDWDVYLTNYGVNVFTGEFLPLPNDTQIVPGLLFTLTSDQQFGVERFELLSSESGDGLYASILDHERATYIPSNLTDEAGTYTLSEVPIPSSVLLLAGGLFGLLGFSRRQKM